MTDAELLDYINDHNETNLPPDMKLNHKKDNDDEQDQPDPATATTG